MKFINVMYHQRSKFELYLEIITQIINGYSHYSELIQCTNLSEYALNQIMEPLISEGLLENVECTKEKDNQIFYLVTEKGEQFIYYLEKALSEIELDKEST